MSHRSKQKACSPCVEAKRRCDKVSPTCSRCREKDLDCLYPHAKRRLDVLQLAQSSVPDATLDNSWAFPWLVDGPLQSTVPTCASFIEPTTLFSTASTFNSLRPPELTPVNLLWFLTPAAWSVTYQQQPPVYIPPKAVLMNFVRGLQAWLVRFLNEGHNPFIHRHLYSRGTIPQYMRDAYSAISITQNVTQQNEQMADDICASYLETLITSQSTKNDLPSPPLTTREHLARTQALLIHVLLALFSPSIARRAWAETLIETLFLWTRQLWDSALLDSAECTLAKDPTTSAASDGTNFESPISSLYQAFVLTESIRRTRLLTNLAIGVYNSLRGTWSSNCAGDFHITASAELWNAPSSARWEAVAHDTDPLFVQSLNGPSLLLHGVKASQVDEFARHVLTMMLGMEQVEQWMVRSGDVVSAMY